MEKMKKARGGFTLAELLIVIAIMAILIAIAIPVFSAQLEKARVAVDQSTQRSAMSMAEADYLLNNSESSGKVYYAFEYDATGQNLKMVDEKAQPTEDAAKSASTVKPKSAVVKENSTDDTTNGDSLVITVEKGVVTGNWSFND